jgi:hypothetical protein
MAQGIALLTGVKDGSTGGMGCENDVDSMAKILSSIGGYKINVLKTELATASAILTCIESAANTLDSGDMFVFYFSGHGSQKKSNDRVEEPDGQDEILCTYASEIVDNDLAALWRKFKSGVRIVMVSDSCYSGTNSNLTDMNAIQDAVKVQTAPKPRKPIRFSGKTSGEKVIISAQLIHLGACRDDQESAGHLSGAFTLTLETVWNGKKGDFTGYCELYNAIRKWLPSDKFPQEPQLNFYGDVQCAFLSSKPFSI